MAKPDISDAWASGGSVTDPGSVKTLLGWIAEIPTFQVFNWILNRIDTYLQHINERGIAEWDAATTYQAGGLAIASDGNTYRLPSGTSLNENPTAGSPWVIYKSGEANDWESGQVILEDTLAFSASRLWDVAVTQNARITLTADMTFTSFDNAKAGGVYVLRPIQDGTGGWLITWPSNIRWPYDLEPTLSTDPDSQDLIAFYYTGTQFLGLPNIGFLV